MQGHRIFVGNGMSGLVFPKTPSAFADWSSNDCRKCLAAYELTDEMMDISSACVHNNKQRILSLIDRNYLNGKEQRTA